MSVYLPDEILLFTFSLVAGKDEKTCDEPSMLRLLRVCQQWRRVALDRSLWRQRVTFSNAIVLSNAWPRARDVTAPLLLDVKLPSPRDYIELRERAHGLFDLSRLGSTTKTLTLDDGNLPAGNIAPLLENFAGEMVTRIDVNFTPNDDAVFLCRALAMCRGLRHLKLTLNQAQLKELREFFLLPLDLTTLSITFAAENQLHDKIWSLDLDLPEVTQVMRSLEVYEQVQVPGSGKVEIFHRPNGFYSADRFPRLRVLRLRRNHMESGLFNGHPPAELEEFNTTLVTADLLVHPRLKHLTLNDARPDNASHILSLSDSPYLRTLDYHSYVHRASLKRIQLVRSFLESCPPGHPLEEVRVHYRHQPFDSRELVSQVFPSLALDVETEQEALPGWTVCITQHPIEIVLRVQEGRTDYHFRRAVTRR